MATLKLSKIWVNLASSGQAVASASAPGRPESYQIGGEVRTYAGGRQRAITRKGEAGTYEFRLLLLDRDAVETLRDWTGQLVQVRDNRGRRYFGVYFGLGVVEQRGRSTWHVDITLRVVTVDEGV